MHDHDTTPLPAFAALAQTIVERSASHHQGPLQSLIHAAGIVEELHELLALIQGEDESPRDADGYADFQYEAGDCIWEIVALALALGIPVFTAISGSELVDPWQDEAVAAAVAVLGHVKKVVRDAPDRQLDHKLVVGNLAVVFRYLECITNRDDALAAVNLKLLRRFPDGFSASGSVNRCA